MLSMYARSAMPYESRIAAFVEHEKRLTWVSLFLSAFKDAQVFLVGGTVRDALRGEAPNDIDVVVRGVQSEALEKWLLQQGAAEFVGRFGTFKFIPHGCGGLEPIDIALPRTEHLGEGAHGSGRRDMEVKFNHTLAIEEDLGRRDFTVNAIAYDIGRGRIIDPFLGIKDLEARLINAVLTPSERFYEDATRILRGLRLASQLQFGIEAETWRAMKAHIHLINKTTSTEEGRHVYAVAREAVGKEFLLGLMRHPVNTLRLWAESGALSIFLPQLAPLETEHLANYSLLRETEQLLHLLHKSTILNTVGLKRISPTAIVAGLLAHLGDNGLPAKEVCVKWHFHQFPKDHIACVSCEGVYWLLAHLHLFEEHDPASLRPSQFEKLFVTHRGSELLALMQAYYASLSAHHIARERVIVAKRIRQKMLDLYCATSQGHTLPRLLSGEDLKALGAQEGPKFRELFDELRDQQLIGAITTKDAAIEFAKQHL